MDDHLCLSAAAPAPKRKLSFKEKHALETLPGEIEKLETKIRQLNDKLAEGNYYTRDPEGFARDSKALAEAEAKRSAAEEQWLELEMLREELEG